MTIDHAGLRQDVTLRHIHHPDEIHACFPVIASLRPGLKDADTWLARVSDMRADGYRLLAAFQAEAIVAIAGYRVLENLVHGRFLYVDDLITAPSSRRLGIGAALLNELSRIGGDEACARLVLDTAATNLEARQFYTRCGLIDAVVGFIKPLETTP